MHILHPHATTLLLHSCLTLFPGGSHRHRFLTLTFRSGVVKPERTSTKRAHEIPPRSTREDAEVVTVAPPGKLTPKVTSLHFAMITSVATKQLLIHPSPRHEFRPGPFGHKPLFPQAANGSILGVRLPKGLSRAQELRHELTTCERHSKDICEYPRRGLREHNPRSLSSLARTQIKKAMLGPTSPS